MNKKMKISLLGTLIAGSSLAVALPMVSCSAKESVVKPEEVKKIINTSIIKNNWIKDLEYIVAAPEFNHFEVRFAEINEYLNNNKFGYLSFELEKYKNFDLDFVSINSNDRKNPENFYFIIEGFEENNYFKIDNIEFKKAKIIIDYDPIISFNSKFRIEKIN